MTLAHKRTGCQMPAGAVQARFGGRKIGLACPGRREARRRLTTRRLHRPRRRKMSAGLSASSGARRPDVASRTLISDDRFIDSIRYGLRDGVVLLGLPQTARAQRCAAREIDAQPH